MVISHHSVPVGHAAHLGVRGASGHLSGAAMGMWLMERILAMMHHG